MATVNVIQGGADSGNLIYTDTVYLTAHDAASAETSGSGTETQVGQRIVGGTTYGLRRIRLGFGGGSAFVPGLIGATIISVSFWVMPSSINYSGGDFNLVPVLGTGLGETLTLADYGALLDNTAIAVGVAASALTVDVYHEFVLNTTGIAAVQAVVDAQADDWVIFGLLSSKDISATAPTGTEDLYIYTSAVSESTRPYLAITYTVPWIPKVCII